MLNRNTYIDEIILTRPEKVFKANCCFCYYPLWEHYQKIVEYLHPDEQKYYETLKFEKRIRSYLIGRITAKQAVAALTGETDLTGISIQSGIFTQPIVNSVNNQNIKVSITHCDDFGAAIAFPEAHPLGIDLEKIYLDKTEVLERQMTQAEQELIRTQPYSYETMLTLLWTAKEALSKVLKTGLMTPFRIYEIDKIEVISNYLLSYYKNFAQYKTVSFNIGNYFCSIVHPLKTEMCLNIESLQRNFSGLLSESE